MLTLSSRQIKGRGIRFKDDGQDEIKSIGGSEFERHFDKQTMPPNVVVDFRLS